MHLFSATELERLVCGNPILDFKALESNARYDGGYSAEHRVSAHCRKQDHVFSSLLNYYKYNYGLSPTAKTCGQVAHKIGLVMQNIIHISRKHVTGA